MSLNTYPANPFPPSTNQMDADALETEVSQIKSGLTNVDVALSVPEGTGKNLIPMTVSGIKAYNTDGTWNGNDYTLNNVVFTILKDSDGYVTGINVNGTASARADFNLVTPGVYIKGGSYKLNGCPADGSSSKYRVQIWNFTQNIGYNDYGSGADVAVNTGDNMGYQITVYSNYTVDNLVFYPMIRPATITDPTFAPYIPSVESRIEALESGVTSLTTTFKVDGSATDLSLWANDNGVVVLSAYIAALDKRVGFKRAADGTISSYESGS